MYKCMYGKFLIGGLVEWRDENTVLSKDGKYILCHSQSKKHECVALFRLGENEIK